MSGANNYGPGVSPNSPNYSSDLNKYQSYDTSGLANRAASNIGQDTANASHQALLKAVQMGGGRSAGTGRTLQDTQALGENRLADFRNQAGMEGFKEKLGQNQAENQFALGKYGADIEKYKANVAADAAEKQRKQGFLNGIFGDVLGGLIGGSGGNY